MPLKAMFDGSSLNPVVQLGGGPVKIHIIDFVNGESCIFDRQSHGTSRLNPGFVWTDPVMRVASRSVSQHFCINWSAPALRRAFAFDDVQPCAFAENKTIAVFGKRSRPTLRTIIPGFGQDSH